MRKFLLSIILVCVLIVPALAHPGRTDGNGGHYDHSTGEYHYHHGYPPHDHEDLDGDGDPDCPHNFVDKTGQDSGESSGSTTGYPAYTRPPTPTSPAVTEPEPEDGSTFWDWVAILVLAPATLLGISCYLAAFKEAVAGGTPDRNTRAYHGSPVREGHPERVPLKVVPPPEPPKVVPLDDKTRLDQFLREYNPTGIIEVEFPPELRMAEDGTLYWGTRTPDKPFGNGTAYITGRSGRCWHMKCGCSGASEPVFIPAILRKRRPCGICVPPQSRSLQVPDWYYKYTLLRSGHFRPHQLSFFDENKA